MVSGTDPTLAPEDGGATSPVRTTSSFTAGTSIGRYILIDRLGAGGMGVVYAAYDPELDRKIALKVMHGRLRPEPERVYGAVMHNLFGDTAPSRKSVPHPDQARLVREAQAAARINDPHVVTVHDVGQHEGAVFIAMEYVRGPTLKEWLRAEKRSWRSVLAVMLQAGAGLVAAHGKDLVHRDFKPDNVMIDETGRARVMDFGLVRGGETRETADDPKPKTDALAMLLTHDGTVMGTPAYMSPEQHLGLEVDARSDQFSFAITVWEGVFGERPFDGKSLEALAVAVTQGRRREPPSDSKVPSWIRRVLERGLATKPEDRYATMRELLVALQRDPTRRRRSIAGLAAVGLLGVGGWAAHRIDGARVQAGCEAEGASIRDVWNDDARAALDAAIAGSGASYAEDTIARVHPWLDKYADAWQATRVDACMHVASDPDSIAVQTIECLDERRRSFASNIEVMSRPDPLTARNAVPLASKLPAIGNCTDPSALARRAPLPDDPTEREQLVALRERLERVQTLELSGDFDEALAMAREIQAEAEALGFQWIVARAQHRVGSTQERLGDYAAAEEGLKAATLALAEMGRDVEAAESASHLAIVVADRRGRVDEGVVWGRWAAVLVARAGMQGELLDAKLHGRLGTIDMRRSAFQSGRDHQARAVEITEAQLGAEHPSMALELNNLGRAESALGNNDEAVRLLERALGIFEATLGPHHPDTAMPLSNLAEIHWRRGELPDARARMERALAIREAAFGPHHPQVGLSLGNLGLLVQEQGELTEALALFERALATVERSFGSDHPDRAQALARLGNCKRELGRVQEALADHERALAILEAGPPRLELGIVLDALGQDHGKLGDHERALDHHRRSAEVLETVVGPTHLHFAGALANVGREEVLLKRWSDALKTMHRSVELLDRADADPYQRGRMRLVLAEAQWETKAEHADAVATVRTARELLLKAGSRAAEPLKEADAWLASHTDP